MDENQIREIFRQELADALGRDKFVFSKNVQIVDGRNIQTGRKTGTQIGTAPDQKVAFFGGAPVAQQSHPTTLADVISVLQALGFTA